MRFAIGLLFLTGFSFSKEMNKETLAPTYAPSPLPTPTPTKGNRKPDKDEKPAQGADETMEDTMIFSRINTGEGRCRVPDGKSNFDQKTCKFRSSEWDDIIDGREDQVSFYDRELTGECGPHCRPTCITLMLDLDRLHLDKLVCDSKELCQCEAEKRQECALKEGLYQDFPKCFLEEASCLGPTVYDNVAHGFNRLGSGLPELPECTAVPCDDFYCRFNDFRVITPEKDWDCKDDHDCFRENKIFFEYCNVVGEDPFCEDCKDDKCAEACPKILEPFPPGWTSFSVSASIPYEAGINSKCDSLLEYEDTGAACFLQRIDIYYPPLDKNGTNDECPHCHECPLLELGDRFGPLEVVGFGHSRLLRPDDKDRNDGCVSCDEQSTLQCSRYSKDDVCDEFQCHDQEDCYTGDLLGIPNFLNQCTFQDNPEPFNSGSSASGGDSQGDSSTGVETQDSSQRPFDEVDRDWNAGVSGIQAEQYTTNEDSFWDRDTIMAVLGVELWIGLVVAAVVVIRRNLKRRRERARMATDDKSRSSRDETCVMAEEDGEAVEVVDG